MFKNITEVKAANKAAGHHWFANGTNNFFGSRIESALYKNQCFVTSEFTCDKASRRFTVRRALGNGCIETVGEFLQYRTKEGARDAAKEQPVLTEGV